MAILVLFSLGCGEDGRLDLRIGSPVEADVETLVDSPVDFAVGLPDLGIVAAGETLLVWDPLSGAPSDHGAGAGAVASATFVGPDTVLVSGDGGLFAVNGRTLVPSPIGDWIESETPPALLGFPGADGDELVVATDDGLFLWKAGVLYDVDERDLPTSDARFAWGPEVEPGDEPSVWVAAGGKIYAFGDTDGSAAVAHVSEHDVDATGLAADGRGDLWASSTDGDLHRRTPGSGWLVGDLDSPARTVAASPRRRDVWVQTDDGLYHGIDDRFARVSNAPVGVLAGADSAGRALVASDAGLFRVAADPAVLFAGLDDGAELVGFAVVAIVPTISTGLVTVEATLDGEPIDVADSPPRVFLDPVALEDGAHELAVEATYEDAGAVRASLGFRVGVLVPATWAADVEPLFVDRCRQCHGPDGGAHLLNTRTRWQNEIEKILEMTTTGRMPLPPNEPLGPEQIQIIQRWRAGGFEE